MTAKYRWQQSTGTILRTRILDNVVQSFPRREREGIILYFKVLLVLGLFGFEMFEILWVLELLAGAPYWDSEKPYRYYKI